MFWINAYGFLTIQLVSTGYLPGSCFPSHMAPSDLPNSRGIYKNANDLDLQLLISTGHLYDLSNDRLNEFYCRRMGTNH